MTQSIPTLISHPGRAGWQEAETARLFSAVKEANATGAPLRSVFESLANDLGRKPNSIRNYYYACLRQQSGPAERSPAFQPFTPEETHDLLRQVLIARGQGISVRACVMALSNGSHSRMLRYQNKYRTLLKSRPELIAQVCAELKQEGLPCPATVPTVTHTTAMHHDRPDIAFCDPEDAAAARLMAQPCVHHMLEGLKELMRRAARAESSATPDDALTERCHELQRTLDRKQVEHDLQRISWEKDFNDCADHLKSVMSRLQAYIALDVDSALLADAMISLRNAESFLAMQTSSLQ